MDHYQCHVTVRGRVQGVFYRASTVAQAEKMGVDGWVRNRGDGSVEAVLAGDRDAVDGLLGWMRQGPAAARVDQLDTSPYDGEVAPGFSSRETVHDQGQGKATYD